MKVLVFGGTGTMGRYLVDFLAEDASNRIYVTSRSRRESARSNVLYIQGNAHDSSFLSDLMEMGKSWDAIVDFMIYSTAEFSKRVSLILNHTKQYVYLSSARVYADSKSPITEESARLLDVIDDEKFLSTDLYALSKAREEDILKNSGKKNWTIIRPYITYSNTRFQLGIFEKEDWLYRALHGRAIVFSNDIAEKLTSFTYGKDVSLGISSLIGKNEALGRAFHITTGDSILWKDILEIYVEILRRHGYPAKVVYVEKASDISSQDEKTKYDRLYNRVFNNEAISKYCDCGRFLSQEEGITQCMKSFLSAPSFKNINWTTQARMDRVSGDKTSFKEINGIKAKAIYFILRYLLSYETCRKLVRIVKK